MVYRWLDRGILSLKVKSMRNKKGRYTSVQVEAKRLFYVRFRLSRFCYLLKVGFVCSVLLIVPLMAWLEHESKGVWTLENASISFPVMIETVKAEEVKPEAVDVERLLRAICTVESNCIHDRVGDNGRSFGAFQINLDAHPDVSIEQAFDFEWAKAWTVKHCKRYIDTPGMFAACHNGIGKYPRNMWYVERVMAVYNGSI